MSHLTPDMEECCLHGNLAPLKKNLPQEPSTKMLEELLALAVSSGSFPIIDFLIDEQEAIAKGAGTQALLVALHKRLGSMVRLLLDKGLDCRGQWGAAIRMAAGIGDAELFRMLADSTDIDPLEEGYDALKIAASLGNIEILRLLFSSAGNPDLARQMGLMIACEHGNLEAVRFISLPEGDSEVLNTGRAMAVAASVGKLETLQFLMENYGEAARKDDRLDNRMLTGAIRMGHLDVVQYLSERMSISTGWQVPAEEIAPEVKTYLEFWRRCENMGFPREQLKSVYENEAIRETIQAGLVKSAEEIQKLADKLAPRRLPVAGRI